MITIPDSGFADWLTLMYPNCMTGNKLDASCIDVQNATDLNMASASSYTQHPVRDLTGIQAFTYITSLDCSDNQITYIPSFASNLQFIACNKNKLTSIPPLPSGLQVLECQDNLLDSIPSNIPQTLYHFICSNNHLTTLPAYPTYGNMQVLDCSYNNITSLPQMSHNLTIFYFEHNRVHDFPLPYSNGNPAYVDCSYNLFDSIISTAVVAPGQLICHHNNISYIPPGWGNYINDFQAQNNNFSSLPNFALSMVKFYIDSNPIVCLPKMPSVTDFRFTGTGITCLPNAFSVTTSNPSIANMPLCDPINPNGCTPYWNISGKVFHDSYNNCFYVSWADSGEANVKMLLYKNGVLKQQVFTNNRGDYTFQTDTGLYSITADTSVFPFRMHCPDSGYLNVNLTIASPFSSNNNFAFVCADSGYDLGIQSINFRGHTIAGNTFTLLPIAGDVTHLFDGRCGNDSGVSGTLQLTISGPVSYVSPYFNALTPTSVNGNVITWNVADFSAINNQTAFGINLRTDTNAHFGPVCFSALITGNGFDFRPANDTLTYCLMIGASHDPNEKEVSPDGIISDEAQWLTYTIHFQNNGNAAAQNVFILDTLTPNVDVSSFQLLASSHESFTAIHGNVVRFDFININLPDSATNDSASQGYVQYRVKTLPGLANGTQIQNTGSIYFDFNSPIVTNTTLNTISVCTTVYSAINQGICNGDEYLFDGHNIDTAGDYTTILHTTNGCDSIVTLHLTVLTVDTSVTLASNTYMATASATTYQWIDCFDNTPVAGATTQTFVPSFAGNYKVAVTQNSCTDTSSCYQTIVTGTPLNQPTLAFELYPNPATDFTAVHLSGYLTGATLQVTDALGKIILQQPVTGNTMQISTSSMQAAVYLVKVTTADGTVVIKKLVIK